MTQRHTTGEHPPKTEQETFDIKGQKYSDITYGENPQQKGAAAYYREDLQDDSLAMHHFKLIEGNPLSYNNFTDIDRLLQTMTHIAAGFDQNYQSSPSAISLGAKHGNVCGASVSEHPTEALEKMLEGDQRAIFGGSVMCNFPIDTAEAEVLLHHKMGTGRRLLDILVVPNISKEAATMLLRKTGKLRLVVNPALEHLGKDSLDSAPRLRNIRGGFLIQDNYTHVLDLETLEPPLDTAVFDQKALQKQRDILLAWAIGATSNSNTISLVKKDTLIGNGVGQQDRVSAAELAIKRALDAGHDTHEAVAYSDSFFPFPDGPTVLAKAGIRTILASSGSVKDAQIRKATKEEGVDFHTIPDHLGRGFYAH